MKKITYTLLGSRPSSSFGTMHHLLPPFRASYSHLCIMIPIYLLLWLFWCRSLIRGDMYFTPYYYSIKPSSSTFQALTDQPGPPEDPCSACSQSRPCQRNDAFPTCNFAHRVSTRNNSGGWSHVSEQILLGLFEPPSTPLPHTQTCCSSCCRPRKKPAWVM